MAVNLSALPEYVEQNKVGLISKSVLGAKTLNYIRIETGVKGKTAINLLNTDVQFGDGSTCGWNEAGTSNVSQREIDPAKLKVNMSFCDKEMSKYFMNHQVNFAAGRATLPFEETFVGDVTKQTNAKLDGIIWQGITVGGKTYKGLMNYAEEEAVKADKGETIYGTVLNVYKALPAEVLENAVIFVGLDTFRDLAMELTAKNLYHYNPTVDGEYEMILPGTTTKVAGVPGLSATNHIVAGDPNHMFYGCDMTDDEEVYRLWYSDDNQEYRLAIAFLAGTQIAFPNQVVWAVTEDK